MGLVGGVCSSSSLACCRAAVPPITNKPNKKTKRPEEKIISWRGTHTAAASFN